MKRESESACLALLSNGVVVGGHVHRLDMVTN